MVGPALAAVCATQEPIAAMRAILAAAKLLMTGGKHPAGCTVAAITLGASPHDHGLQSATRDIFNRWQRTFRDCLHRNGAGEPQATDLATLVIAGMEGALVLCRVEGTTEPLDRVTAGLERALTPLTRQSLRRC